MLVCGALLFVGIPLREWFLVGEDSVMARFVERFKGDPDSKVVRIDKFFRTAKLR